MKVEFIESAPRPLSDGVLYISDRFRTALHLCCCGCGKEVVTPLNPAGWSYKREAGNVTLKPSIGNWSFPCRSHYLIVRNEVVWAKPMSTQQIAMVKGKDSRDQKAFIDVSNAAKVSKNVKPQVISGSAPIESKGLFAHVELTPFRGHRIVQQLGVQDAQTAYPKAAVLGAISRAIGRARPSRAQPQ